MVGKGHCLQGFRDGTAQTGGVVFHDHGHLLPADSGIRGEGGAADAVHNSPVCRPGSIGGIVRIGLHIGEPSGRMICRINTCQPPESGHKHSPGHAGVGAEGSGAGAVQQAPAGGKENMILCPVIFDVRKGWSLCIIPHAIGAGPGQSKNDRFLAGIVAGSRDPLKTAVSVCTDCIQAARLLVLLRDVRDGDPDGLSVQSVQPRLLAVLHFPQGDGINRPVSNDRPGFRREISGLLCRQEDIAAGLAVQLPEGFQCKTKVGHMVGIDGEPSDIGGNERIQGICFQSDPDAVQRFSSLHRDRHLNAVFLAAVLFRTIPGRLNGIRHSGLSDGPAALAVHTDLLPHRRGGSIRSIPAGPPGDGGIIIRGFILIVGGGTAVSGTRGIVVSSARLLGDCKAHLCRSGGPVVVGHGDGGPVGASAQAGSGPDRVGRILAACRDSRSLRFVEDKGRRIAV